MSTAKEHKASNQPLHNCQDVLLRHFLLLVELLLPPTSCSEPSNIALPTEPESGAHHFRFGVRAGACDCVCVPMFMFVRAHQSRNLVLRSSRHVGFSQPSLIRFSR